jgi:hypothetical protein
VTEKICCTCALLYAESELTPTANCVRRWRNAAAYDGFRIRRTALPRMQFYSTPWIEDPRAMSCDKEQMKPCCMGCSSDAIPFTPIPK